MPRTASTSQNRQSLHSRLRREQRDRKPSETERTPVLLRLPEVELPTEETLNSDEAYAIPSEMESEPTYTELPAPEPAPAEETQESQESLDDGIPEAASQLSTASTDAAFEQTVIRETEQTVEETAPELATQTIVSTPQTPATASLNSEEEYALHSASDSDATWWEHWSSGVVLILLIIALVTASIIAFNDTTETDPALLAENPTAATTDSVGRQDELQIPGLEAPTTAVPSVPAVELPTALELSEPVSSSESALLLSDPIEPTGESSPSLLIPPLQNNELQFAADPTIDSSTANRDSLLELPNPTATASQQVGTPATETPSLQLGSLAGDVPTGNATAPIQSGLQPPVSEPDLPLFPSSQMAGKVELPLPGAFDSNAGMPSPNGSNSGPATPDLSNYARATEQLQSTPPNQPSSYQELVARQKQMEESGQFSVASSSSGPTISNASLIDGAKAQPAQPQTNSATQPSSPSTTSSGVAETATPDSDIDALIEAYRFFDRASKPDTTNRYPGGE